MSLTAAHVLLDSRSMLSVLGQVAIVVLFFGGGFLLLRWLLPKVRRARHRAWEEAGLLEPEHEDAAMNPEGRARPMAAPDDAADDSRGQASL